MSKSTTAAGLFHALKIRGFNAELVSEFAKVLAWEKNHALLSDQFYITAKQNRSLERLDGQVSHIVTDSPLPLGIHYATNYKLKSFEQMVWELFDSYNNVNFLIRRKKKYNPAGRFQNEEEAREIDVAIEKLLIKNDVPFHVIDGDHTAIDSILNHLGLEVSK